MEQHARENILDLIKASLAGLMASMSMATAEAAIAIMTVIYLLALLIEKLWKFCQWLKARRAANGPA